jgi:hypothetical protein
MYSHRNPRRLNGLSDLISSGFDSTTDVLSDMIGEGVGQASIEAKVRLLEDKAAPHYTLNASYKYCIEDTTNAMNCEAVAWFPRLEQYDFPKVTKLKELNDLLSKVGISERVSVVNEGILKKLRARMFYDTANSYNLLSVTPTEAQDIAKKGFERVSSARSVKINDRTYRRESVLNLAKKLANGVEIFDEKESTSYPRMIEKMTAIEDAFLNFPSFKTTLLSTPLAKHLAAQVGTQFSIPKLRIYLNPERTAFVEYTDSNKQIKVVSKDLNETISAESALLKPDELARITPQQDGSLATGQGQGAFADSSKAWYKTWWGISLIGVGVAGVAYGTHKVISKNKKSI